MFQVVRENWAYAYQRAEERFQVAQAQTTTWYKRVVHYAVGGVEWYVPMLGQIVAFVDWYAIGKLGEVVQKPVAPPEVLQKRVPLRDKTAAEFLGENAIEYLTERDKGIQNLLTQMTTTGEDWKDTDADKVWLEQRRRPIHGALVLFKGVNIGDEKVVSRLEQDMRSNDGAKLKSCWQELFTLVSEKAKEPDDYLRRVDEAFGKIEVADYSPAWMVPLHTLKRFAALLSVNAQIGKDSYEICLGHVQSRVKSWPEKYNTAKFLSRPSEPVQDVVAELEKLCETRAVDEIRTKLQVERARAQVTGFQAKDLKGYLEYIGIKTREDYSTFLGCEERGLAERGLNTLKDLESLELNRWEDRLIQMKQFSVGLAIDPAYELQEYQAFVQKLDPQGGKLPQAATVERTLELLEGFDKDRQRKELRSYILQTDCVLFWKGIRETQGVTTTLSTFQEVFKLQREALYRLREQNGLFA